MKQLVIGLGEVGSAIQNILECDGYDTFRSIYPSEDLYDVIHVCFPYSDTFEKNVVDHREKFAATLVVVHSTVPLGTCERLGAVHSPIRGVHPHLERGIRTFVKFFGGKDAEAAADIFRRRGVKCMTTERSAETEAMKLWDTTQYGIMILLEKSMHAYCEKHGLDPSMVYTLPNATYNNGYATLGRYDVQRPVLKHVPGPIGGHCVRQNWELLDDPIAELSKTLHKDLTGE